MSKYKIETMKIEKYEFGKIIIDGRTFDKDLKICINKIIPEWWRKEGHHLYLEDIQDLLEKEPEVLIIGTGYVGMMKVDREVKEYCEKRGISLHVNRTSKAVKLFNELVQQKKKIAAAFHLTC